VTEVQSFRLGIASAFALQLEFASLHLHPEARFCRCLIAIPDSFHKLRIDESKAVQTGSEVYVTNIRMTRQWNSGCYPTALIEKFLTGVFFELGSG